MEPAPLHPPVVRDELVDRVRREIEQGTYDSPEKLEAALERMAARFFGN